MPRRFARTTDLPAIANIFANAFWDEDVMGDIIHPHRNEYPEDFRRYWNQQVRAWYWDYRHQLVVTYCLRPKHQSTISQNGEPADVEEVLTGAGDWIRQGTGGWRYRGLWGSFDPRNVIHLVIKFFNSASSFFFPNRAADPSKLPILTAIFPLISHHWSSVPRRSENWYLNFLGVDPAYQNQGYGRELVRWGMDQSRKEDVAASVIAGTGKEQFYRLCGFNVEVGRLTEEGGEGNPLKGLTEGGMIMFREATVNAKTAEKGALKS